MCQVGRGKTMAHEDAKEDSTTVSRQEAERECIRHSCDELQMEATLGNRPEYQDVPRWLGC